LIDLTRRLSRNFSLAELAGCEPGPWHDLQLAGLSVYPGHGPRDTVVARLEVLARTILQPIRDHVGVPIHVNSGYRCKARNDVTKGSSPVSQHLCGEAADLHVPGWDDDQLRALWSWIGHTSGLPFGQVIFEDRRPDARFEGAWLHVSLGAPYRSASLCGERLTWTPDGYRSV
jgi:zinc D-Ala-D-Ala carboxypeptidase